MAIIVFFNSIIIGYIVSFFDNKEKDNSDKSYCYAIATTLGEPSDVAVPFYRNSIIQGVSLIVLMITMLVVLG